jgi:hypothetical protein
MLRNLRYKLTYAQILKSFLKTSSNPRTADLFKKLAEAQEAAIASLRIYLQGLGIGTDDLQLNQQLMAHAAQRNDISSRLRFMHYGLDRAASWYKIQLKDDKMTSDPDLRDLLLTLGEIDAARLWHTRMVMQSLQITTDPNRKTDDATARPSGKAEWRPHLVEDLAQHSQQGQTKRSKSKQRRVRRSSRKN